MGQPTKPEKVIIDGEEIDLRTVMLADLKGDLRDKVRRMQSELMMEQY